MGPPDTCRYSPGRSGSDPYMRSEPLSVIFKTTGPFATALLDVSQDTENGRHEHDLRVRETRTALTEQGADERTVEAVCSRLAETVNRPAPVARLVVAGADGVVFDDTVGARVDQPTATWGPLPDLGTWIAQQDALTRFVLAEVDHAGGQVAVYDSDVPEAEDRTTVDGETEHIHKVPVGGWSALRYMHYTENVWKENAEALTDEIISAVRAGNRLVLLAGDPHSRHFVREKLGDTAATVVEIGSHSRAEDGGEEALAQAIRETLLDQVVQRRLERGHELKDRLGQGRAVATGVGDVADAFVRGQVETLLIDPQPAAELTLDPGKHPGLALGAVNPQEPVRADQALIAAAVLTDAEIAVMPRASLGGAPVAALLRWDQSA